MNNNGAQRLTADEMDDIRQKNVAYQYLCHLEEAKKWIEMCIHEKLPEVCDLEEGFCHGIYLAKLAHFFAPKIVPLKKIFDADLSRYNSSGLHFRHTDNINYFLQALKHIGLPTIFYPETTDIYEKKNIPRTVFCLHALSLFLFRLGAAPKIQDLYGKIQFSDEVMETMMKELSKFGCQMPQFTKIGGILANEFPIDEAALHAAIIAINDAIQKHDQAELHTTLANPNSHLTDIVLENVDKYLFILSDAQLEKKEVAFNKSREDSYIPDAYDELLTRKEIQGFIEHTNMYCALENVESAVKSNDPNSLFLALCSPVLRLKDIRKKQVENYRLALKDEIEHQSTNDLENLIDCRLSLSSIGQVIRSVHQSAEEENLVERKLLNINLCLEKGSPHETLMALKGLQSHVAYILDYGAPLYHEEMKAIRTEKAANLELKEMVGGLRCLTAIAQINASLDTSNASQIWQYLSAPQAYLQNLEKFNLQNYIDYLTRAKLMKASSENRCPLLTHLDLQDIVDHVNREKELENSKVDAVTSVNEALLTSDLKALLSALQNPGLNLSSSVKNGTHFYNLLQKLRFNKLTSTDQSEGQIWLEDILEVDKLVKSHEKSASSICSSLHHINHACAAKDVQAIASILRKFDLPNIHIRRDIIEELGQKILDTYLARDSKDKTPWIEHVLDDDSLVLLNILSGETMWERTPEAPASSTKLISVKDIKEALSGILQDISINQKVEKCLVGLQAACRGYMTRKKLNAYSASTIKIQAWWRMVLVRRNYLMYKEALKMLEPQIILIQRLVRKWLQRRRIKNLHSHLHDNVDKVIVIQRAWRKHKAKQDLQALTHCDNPSLSVIQKFIHLLEVSSHDFEEELKLQQLKSDVVKSIKHSQELEAEIDKLDVSIGLLVRNRITLQDVIEVDKENMNPNVNLQEAKKSKKHPKNSEKISTLNSKKGLKAWKKESRRKLDRYQHLFYLLQTQPHYLASLIFAIPPGKTTKFIENVIFTLYNYGANDRDNFLLLKLLKTALEEEIRCKVLRLNDIVSGNHLVIKMIVSFNRKGAGQKSLRDLLGPLVEKVVRDKKIQINTNPIELYKTWVNQLEMQTGEASGLPYNVTEEQALEYPEVQTRLLRAVNTLREMSVAFCNHITTSRHLIPYAMQYMAKVLWGALHRRFPHIPDKEILKVVGNLVYYRFINSAIIAPDAFDIITVSPESKLTNDRRLNLASIAKILQFAASKKGFGEEAAHLMCLNPLIIELHEKFKVFFRECCQVEEPEIVYNVSQYSEASLIIKPTVHVTLQELVETHGILLDYQHLIAPDDDDPLRKILQELGERPTLFTIIGDSEHILTESSESTLARTEICLALSNKFDRLDLTDPKKDGKDEQLKLFIKSKQLLIDILQCSHGNLISELVSGPTLPKQEDKYRTVVGNRSLQEHKARLNNTILNRSNSFLGEARVSLHEVKTRLSHNLRRLENKGLTTRQDNYQSLLNAIAKDIVNQRYHRVSRRMELHNLFMAYKKLDAKEGFYLDQVKSYKDYLNTCLDKMNARNKNVHQAADSMGINKARKGKSTVRYTASKLMEKGVILEIEDLPAHQPKNISFEISPLSATGVFQVQVKLMGVGMESLQIDIQELLQLQYEGVSIKRMMGRVIVNVNLLLHLLNTKFYSKKK